MSSNAVREKPVRIRRKPISNYALSNSGTFQSGHFSILHFPQHFQTLEHQNLKCTKLFLNFFQALQAIVKGQSINKTSNKFSIPARTLRDWMKRLKIKSVFTHHSQGANKANKTEGKDGGNNEDAEALNDIEAGIKIEEDEHDQDEEEEEEEEIGAPNATTAGNKENQVNILNRKTFSISSKFV